MMEKKDFLDMPFAVKSDHGPGFKAEVDQSQRTVDLVANTYYYMDSYGDVLVKGCCAKTIKDKGPKSALPGKIKHLSNHDLTKGIGRVDMIEETEYKGMIVLHANSWMSETIEGEQTLIKYKEGLIDQHSIGFRYLDLEWIEEGSDKWDQMMAKIINPEEAIRRKMMFVVKEIELFEYSSLDGFGANRLTPFLGVKTDNKLIHYNNLVTKLDVLIQAARAGGDKDLITLQERQIKQMIYEIYHPEPSPKDTAQSRSRQEDDTFDVSKAIDNFKLKIN